jgi:hypothetical protein
VTHKTRKKVIDGKRLPCNEGNGWRKMGRIFAMRKKHSRALEQAAPVMIEMPTDEAKSEKTETTAKL